MTISADTITSDVWNTFRNLINTNVTSVTIKGKNGPNTETVTVQNVSSSFPEQVFDNKNNYPIVIINPPQINFTPVTFRNRELEGTIEFEIFTTQSESADKFVDKLNKVIMDNESTLRSDGFEALELDSTDSNHYERDKLSVNARMVVWRFRFTW